MVLATKFFGNLYPGNPNGGGAGRKAIVEQCVEYSLLERTVEGELTPIAQNLGIGVMPWSPLKNGWLTGKYTRENAGNTASGRSALIGVPAEKDYLVIDALLTRLKK